MKRFFTLLGAVVAFLSGAALIIGFVFGGAVLFPIFREMGVGADDFQDTYLFMLNFGGKQVEVSRWVIAALLVVELMIGVLLIWIGKVLLARDAER